MSLSCEPGYSQLLALLVALCESQANKPIAPGEEWKNDAQALTLKIHHHLYSMREIASGASTNYEGTGDLAFIDHSSVKVLARAALETYLTFGFVYGANDLEEARYRHTCWKLGGLLDRQKLKTFTAEGKAAQATELHQVNFLKQELNENIFFKAQPANARKKILKGEWRAFLSWVDIGVLVGFHEKYIRNVYSYLCGYSHSSWISLLQVAQAKSLEEQRMLTTAIMGIGAVILAYHSASYVHIFPSASHVLDANPEKAKLTELWRFGASDMADIYES